MGAHVKKYAGWWTYDMQPRVYKKGESEYRTPLAISTSTGITAMVTASRCVPLLC